MRELPVRTRTVNVEIKGKDQLQLPTALQNEISVILSSEEYKELLMDLDIFSRNQFIDRTAQFEIPDPRYNKFDGFVRSYQGPETHPDDPLHPGRHLLRGETDGSHGRGNVLDRNPPD